MPHRRKSPRHVTFVTGTRADLRLMRRALAAIDRTPGLRLSVIATGMHLDPRHGPPLAAVHDVLGRPPDLTVPWRRTHDVFAQSRATGLAAARLADAYHALGTQALLIVGDRVEAFAAAAAAHLARIPIAHVHGGDRAEGQTDDALRHAITHLSHLHLAASADAARRLRRLGQDPSTVHHVGAPGLERIAADAEPANSIQADFGPVRPGHAAVVLLHPTSPDPALEFDRTLMLLRALNAAALPLPIFLAPNNDPGSDGIRAAYRELGIRPLADLPRPRFLGLLRAAGVLLGNSSAGIIEAPSLGVAVLDIGPRQGGRVRSRCTAHVDWSAGQAGLLRAIRRAVHRRLAGPHTTDNPYEPPTGRGGTTSMRMVRLLMSSWMDYPASPKRLSH